MLAFYTKGLKAQGFKAVPGESVGTVPSKDFLRGDNETVNICGHGYRRPVHLHDRRERRCRVRQVTLAEQLRLEQTDFVASVAGKLTDFLTSRQAVMSAISQDIDPLMGSISNLVTGGKTPPGPHVLLGLARRGRGGRGRPRSVTAGSALELFQAAALIHDDIIDRSDTRRGGPSVHRRFSELHETQGWALDSERFGHAAAILTGDLCLSFSEESFTEIGRPCRFRQPGAADLQPHAGRSHGRPVPRHPRRSRRAPAGPGRCGQPRTVHHPGSSPPSTPRSTHWRWAAHWPAPATSCSRGYSAFALPLGEAFQLRDDVLGVFGDPVTTGKPAGDDLREGKRTVLVAFALDQASPAESEFIDAKLGSPDLSDSDIAEIRRIIVECGALQATEVLIDEFGKAAYAALDLLPLEELPKTALRKLAEATVSRAA